MARNQPPKKPLFFTPETEEVVFPAVGLKPATPHLQSPPRHHHLHEERCQALHVTPGLPFSSW
ncbi:hypothetical protein I3760_01G027300 [Carya illinoinensis]|nr:hypothetical protein I3760_01G027300 [Carya illinoinensis]